MFKDIIEIDVDGVLADIHCGLNPYVEDLMPGFDGDTHIQSWGMKELNELNKHLRPRILSLFKDPSFIGNLKPFDGVIGSLRKLGDYAKQNNLKLVLHTNVAPEVAEVRVLWIEHLLNCSGVEAHILVKSSLDKEMLYSWVVIEDNVENLRNSTARYKILVRRGHNRSATLHHLGSYWGARCVNNFSEAVDFIVNGNLATA